MLRSPDFTISIASLDFGALRQGDGDFLVDCYAIFADAPRSLSPRPVPGTIRIGALLLMWGIETEEETCILTAVSGSTMTLGPRTSSMPFPLRSTLAQAALAIRQRVTAPRRTLRSRPADDE